MLRDEGITIGGLAPGPRNSISDVPGVTVGHVTVIRDEPEPPAGRGIARTGVTAVLPKAFERLTREPVSAGVAVLNGAGELTSSHEIAEWGLLETPVYLTSTMAVGRVYDGAVAAAVAADPNVGVENVVIPCVGECDDSWLSDARTVHVEAGDVSKALASAAAEFEQGAVGAGTGMCCLGWKGGIGSSSRAVAAHTIGVLVLANFGSRAQLRVDGVPVGLQLDSQETEPEPGGSCIAVVATDAPLAPAQLERVARRAGLGLARTGSVAHHGSGEIFVAFSTAAGRTFPDAELDGMFAATVEATEESVLNALWSATDTTGRNGRLARALPHDPVLALLDRYRGLGR